MHGQRHLGGRFLDTVLALPRHGGLEGQEFAAVRVNAHRLALKDAFLGAHLRENGLRHLRKHARHVLEIPAVDADARPVAMDLHTEAIELCLDGRAPDFVDDFGAAGEALGLGHADRKAHAHRRGLHGSAPVCHIVVRDQS